MRRGPKPAKSTEAKPPVARKSPKNDDARVRDLERRLAEALGQLQTRDRELTEALDQQTVTSEILRVISSSPSDVQPVLDAVAESAARLCDAVTATVFRFDGTLIHLVAHRNVDPARLDALRRVYPMLPSRGAVAGRVIIMRSVVHVADVSEDPEYTLPLATTVGFRSVLGVPMLREGDASGVILVARDRVAPFSEAHTALLKTFAHQAVIAIENVRLFKELEARNRDLTQALEQQTAVGEILQTISSSPTDLQPTLQTIARNAVNACGATDAAVFLRDGDDLVAGSHRGPIGFQTTGFRYPVTSGTVPGRTVIDACPIQVADLAVADDFPEGRVLAEQFGVRAAAAVPLLRKGVAIGALMIRRVESGLFSDKQMQSLGTFADQAVIAIENVRLFTEVQARNADLAEALEQQTATSEVLKVISRSAFDLQPVLNSLIESAVRLCGADRGFIHRQEGEFYPVAASYGHSPDWIEVVTRNPIRRDRRSATGRAGLERRTVHIHDILADPEYGWADDHRGQEEMHRTILAVPMLREGTVIGVITIRRTHVQPFTEKQIELITTFADQAVIAIENVRLFKELEEKNSALTTAHSEVTEALEQQTATAEILRVIASSPTDVQPVFDAIARHAVMLCGGRGGILVRYDGELMHLAAHHNVTPEGVERNEIAFPRPPDRTSPSGVTILDQTIIHVPDLQASAQFAGSPAQRSGNGSVIVVPLLHHGAAIGTINVTRQEVGGFSEREIALLQTFADQAVIAIENVRLFTELEARNRDLTRALEQQTATSELLKVIGRSTFDLQPVFETLVENARRLCEAERAFVHRFDGEVLRVVATHNVTPELRAFVEQNPFPVGRHTVMARSGLERRTIHMHDVQSDPELTYPGNVIEPVRSALAVPMLRAAKLLGVIMVYRHEVRPFSDGQIALLETFADQAAIAIENAQLLTELQARTRDLTRSVDELTALGEVGRALSSTLDLEIVLSTIVARANQLSGAVGGSVYEYDETTEEFSLRASRDLPDAYVEQVRDFRPRKGEGALGRVALTRAPVQVADIAEPGAYESRVRDTLLHIGIRALLAVPLVAEDRLVGALIVMRNRAGDFASAEVELLQTFATQSALAIQNARLFREIQEKSRQLETASQHKSEFLANMSHELRTPLNAIIGYSEMLQEEAQDRHQEALIPDLEKINAAAKHQLALINDILDLSKVEAGKMELELTDFHLPTVLDNALTLVRERATRRGIVLQATIDPQLGDVRADERKIKQVVLNLLSNAIKFTPEGGRIDVRALPVEGDVEVSVSDTGVGIAPEDQDAVFEEFRQVGVSATKQEGTGLGLTLCRKFVELHGGRIWVKSQEGAGSTFTFTIPVSRGA